MLTITGRVKDILIRNMENVSAKEVADLLFGHPDVADIAVIGVPADRTGERVCAVVVPADPAPPPRLPAIAPWALEPGPITPQLPAPPATGEVLPRDHTATRSGERTE